MDPGGNALDLVPLSAISHHPQSVHYGIFRLWHDMVCQCQSSL